MMDDDEEAALAQY